MKIEQRIMEALGKFVTKFPVWILIGGLFLIVLSIISSLNIEMKTKLEDLLPENNPKIESYKELNELFSGGSMVMITIEGKDKVKMAECAERFAGDVRNNETIIKYIRTITLKLDKEYIKKWGLLLQKAKDLEKTKKTLSHLNLLPFIKALNDSFEETYIEEEEEINTRAQENKAVSMFNQLEAFFTLLREFLENPGTSGEELKSQGVKLAETFMYGDEYGYNHDNTMLMFTIYPNFNIMEVEKIKEMMEGIKLIRKNVQKDFPGLKVSYTGDVAVQADEQDAMSIDLGAPAIVALFIILLLFIFSFKQIRSVVFVILTLIVGIIFSFGVLGITIGEINMLTSIMAVLLIGLGVDYGIQIITNFNTFRADGLNPKEAIISTYKKGGMGIILAALTTAIGFFVMSATGSKAFAQFGVVMGIGILNCLLAMIIILPALLLLLGRKRDLKQSRIPKINFNFLSSLGKLTNKHKWITIFMGIIVTTVMLLCAIFLNEQEYDLMKLEPPDMPSIIQYKKVMEKFDINPFASMVIADSIEEVRELTEKLEKEPLVAEVSSISQFIPEENELNERLKILDNIHNTEGRYEDNYNYSEKTIKDFLFEIQRFEYNIIEIGQLSVAGLGENNKIVLKRNEMIHEILGSESGKPGKEVFQNLINLVKKNPPLYSERLNILDKYFGIEMDKIVSDMTSAGTSVTIEDIKKDLPEYIVKGMYDMSGTRNLLMIYPRKDLFDHLDNLDRFNQALYKISPKITGTSQIAVEWMNEMNEAAPKAAFFIFLAVILFLILTFRNFKYTLFAVIPLLCGMICMMGLYPLFGFKLNMMNVIVIPLVIGMGIDFGIHIAHRFKTEGNIETTYRFTGKGVFLSALTTMIGFGSLGLMGKFPAIASYGAILFFGITSCLITTIVLLPALLAFIKSRKISRGAIKN